MFHFWSLTWVQLENVLTTEFGLNSHVHISQWNCKLRMLLLVSVWEICLVDVHYSNSNINIWECKDFNSLKRQVCNCTLTSTACASHSKWSFQSIEIRWWCPKDDKWYGCVSCFSTWKGQKSTIPWVFPPGKECTWAWALRNNWNARAVLSV